MHDAIATFGERQIMRDQEERRAALAPEPEDEVRDLGAGRFVEVPRRFIGAKDRRVRSQRACHCDPLLLAAGELGGIMGEAIAKADGAQFRRGALERIRATRELERNRHVLQRRHRRDEMKGLKNDADVSPAELGKIILIEVRKVLARDLDRAGIDPFQPGDRHEQG